ncbi:MAG: T9SS type A sorting domain-containing protein [Ferruginibacter sp.]
MKKVYFFFLTLLLCAGIYAQVSVTATAGVTGPTAYTTLANAFAAINAGTHQGVINIAINGNTIETGTAVLNASGGSAVYSSVLIKPNGGAARSISGNINGPLIDLNGADNVVVDGLNSGGNSLTFTNSSISSLNSTSTIRFINDATTDSILNATILGADTSITSGTVLFSTGTATGNDNNVISGCNIADAGGLTPTNAIYSLGTAAAGQENSSVKISGNNISNFFNPGYATSGIILAAGNTGWTIVTNRFFQTATRTFTVAAIQRAIQITGGDGYLITDNVIGFGSASGLGAYSIAGAVATRFIAIDLALGATTASSVQNNTISRFSFSTSASTSSGTGIWCAINLSAGNANIGTVSGNIIGSTSGIGNISIATTGSGAWVTAIVANSSGTVNISNNNIGSIALQPSAALSGTINTINLAAATGTYNVSNNIIGNTSASNISVGTVGVTTGNGNIRGIFNVNSGTVNITGNIIRNLSHNSANILALFRAIEFQVGTGTISGNIISDITANGLAAAATTPEGAGILVSTPTPGLVIDHNTIFNLNVINSTPVAGPVVTGIYLNSGVTNISVTGNVLYGFTNAGTATSATAPSIITGIYCRDAGATGPNILLANNMISFGNSQSTNTAIIGIWNSSASANGLTTKIYYNSVNIEGAAATGAQPSFCYYRGDFSATSFATPIVDIRNNIFTNTRNGGTGKHYAIANAYPNGSSNAGGWSSNASNYNVLNANAATIGYWSGDQTFAGWQTAAASDANSLSGVIVNYVNSSSDLHLVNNSNAAVDGKGTPVAGQTIDIDNDPRNATTPDPGADEFTNPIPVIFEYFKGQKQGTVNILNWKAFCTSPSVRFDIERSSDARRFSNIGSINATQTRSLQPFDFTDNIPLSGTNYYRLKMTESDGAVSYSIIVAIINKETGLEIVNLMPTLVDKGHAVLNVSTAKNSKLNIVITDLNGKIVYTQTASLNAGSNTININLEQLAAGAYQLTGYDATGKIKTIRFIKE